MEDGEHVLDLDQVNYNHWSKYVLQFSLSLIWKSWQWKLSLGASRLRLFFPIAVLDVGKGEGGLGSFRFFWTTIEH